MGRRGAKRACLPSIYLLVRIGLGGSLVQFACLAASCDTAKRSSQPSSTTIAPPTVMVLETATPQTSCLLDPARARDEVATIDWSTREVSLTDGLGNAVTVVPPYQTGSDYFGEAYGFPAVSPAGTEIVVGAHFRQKDGSSLTGLWRVDLSDLKRTLLLASDDAKSFALDDAAFSPDGKDVAFTRTNVKWRPTHGHDDTYEVWVMEADGSNPRKVADGGTPRWSNDGKYLSFALLPHDRLSPQIVVDTLRFQPVPDVSISACPP